MAHVLTDVNQSQWYVDSQPLKSCLKLMNTEKKPKRCPLMTSIWKTLFWKEYSPKKSNDFIKWVHIRLSLDNSAIAKKPMLSSDFDCQSTYIPVNDPSDALLDHVAVLIPEEEQQEQSITALLSDKPSDESLYKPAATFSLMKNEMVRCLLRRCLIWYFNNHKETCTMTDARRKAYFCHYKCTYWFSDSKTLIYVNKL